MKCNSEDIFDERNQYLSISAPLLRHFQGRRLFYGTPVDKQNTHQNHWKVQHHITRGLDMCQGNVVCSGEFKIDDVLGCLRSGN